MNNEPLKKYIREKRDEFDYLEPSPEVFLKLKEQLKIQAEPDKQKTGSKGLFSVKWMAAAAVLLIVSASLLLINRYKPLAPGQSPVITKSGETENLSIKAGNNHLNNETAIASHVSSAATNSKTKRIKNNDTRKRQVDMAAIYYQLSDSSSASNRLAAILQIQKSNRMNYDLVDRLANILNYDSNSNVRLAAFNVMSLYAHDTHINQTLTQAFEHQDDPTIQLALMNLLGQTNSAISDERLYALVNDPSTIAVVRNQAYFILLNQNKL